MTTLNRNFNDIFPDLIISFPTLPFFQNGRTFLGCSSHYAASGFPSQSATKKKNNNNIKTTFNKAVEKETCWCIQLSLYKTKCNAIPHVESKSSLFNPPLPNQTISSSSLSPAFLTKMAAKIENKTCWAHVNFPTLTLLLATFSLLSSSTCLRLYSSICEI